MKKIEVGMLVEIVADPSSVVGAESRALAIKYRGHIGRVLSFFDSSPTFGDRVKVDGADPDGETVWCVWALRPVDPPEEATWEAIEKATGWSPLREKEFVNG